MVLTKSYLKYLDFKARSELTHVFYLFFANDLRNIYENQLFDFNKDEIGEPLSPRINPVIDIARKFHVVYLLLDSYVRLKAKIDNETYDPEALNKKVKRRFVADNLREARRERREIHDEYADSLVKDYLTDAPSESSLEWAKRFRLLLDAWARDARDAGQEFVILVTPSQVSTDLAKKLFGQQFAGRTVYIIDYHAEGEGIVTFENDAHWNEQGNLRTANAIVDWGAANGVWVRGQRQMDSVGEEHRACHRKAIWPVGAGHNRLAQQREVAARVKWSTIKPAATKHYPLGPVGDRADYEPPRVSGRLNSLRGLGHEYKKTIFPGVLVTLPRN